MLVEGIYQYLIASSSITAIVGTPATRKDLKTGVWPIQLPEASPLPALVYSQISGDGNPSLDGGNQLHQCRVEFACYADNYLDAKKLQRAIRQLLEGLHGTFPDGTPIDNVILVLETDAFEEAPFIFNAPIDFTMVYADVPAGTPGPAPVIPDPIDLDGGDF